MKPEDITAARLKIMEMVCYHIQTKNETTESLIEDLLDLEIKGIFNNGQIAAFKEAKELLANK